jgi:Rrf2 family protein
MKLVPTRRTDYGLRAMIHLAHNPARLSKAAEIAEDMHIPPGFLYQVLRELQRARLVTSQPSRHGGYRLGKHPEQITVLEIVEALEGPLLPGECALHAGPCRWDQVCALHATWSAARQALVDTLGAATLARIADDDLALAAGTLPIPPDAHRRPGAAQAAQTAAPTAQKRSREHQGAAARVRRVRSAGT